MFNRFFNIYPKQENQNYRWKFNSSLNRSNISSNNDDSKYDDIYSIDNDMEFYKRYQYKQSNVLLPVLLGLSVAAGVMTTKLIQRVLSNNVASNAVKDGTAKVVNEAQEIPQEFATKLTARQMFGGLPYSGGFREPMDIQEAALILGCREIANLKTIDKRFKKLMLLNHPDRGGSPYVASKLNEAKTILSKNKD
mmetsp:Transcript_9477/g.11879  ORF Transcript_9477/g.11879 Transcript_9477/m.11879 type:complete len:194 (-) Transcript_9477:92-673(-)